MIYYPSNYKSHETSERIVKEFEGAQTLVVVGFDAGRARRRKSKKKMLKNDDDSARVQSWAKMFTFSCVVALKSLKSSPRWRLLNLFISENFHVKRGALTETSKSRNQQNPKRHIKFLLKLMRERRQTMAQNETIQEMSVWKSLSEERRKTFRKFLARLSSSLSWCAFVCLNELITSRVELSKISEELTLTTHGISTPFFLGEKCSTPRECHEFLCLSIYVYESQNQTENFSL